MELETETETPMPKTRAASNKLDVSLRLSEKMSGDIDELADFFDQNRNELIREGLGIGLDSIRERKNRQLVTQKLERGLSNES